LKTGIYISFEDGSYTKYIQSAPDEITEIMFDASQPGDADIFTTLYGVFEVAYAWSPASKIDASSLETVRYLTELPARDELVPGFAFGSVIITDYADPAVAATRAAYSVSVDRAEQRMIGACRYEALAINHTYVRMDGMTRLSARYIPELGISIIEGLTEPGFGRTDFPAAISIANVAP
jgi:hypothetical protein